MNTSILLNIYHYEETQKIHSVFMKSVVHYYYNILSSFLIQQNIRTCYNLIITYYLMVNLLPNKLFLTPLWPDEVIDIFNYTCRICTYFKVYPQQNTYSNETTHHKPSQTAPPTGDKYSKV